MKHLLTFLVSFTLSVLLSAQPIVLNYGSFNIRYAGGDRKDPERCWTARRDRVARFILQEKLSIVGLQEVLHEQLTDLKSLLPDYDYEGVGREDGKQKGEYAPIFWNRKEWRKEKGGTFWLSPTPEVVASVGWDAALTRIASYVLLRHVETGRLLMCVNTHFDHVGHTARQESARLIMQRARSMLSDVCSQQQGEHDIPFVLTGDLNVAMNDAAYHTITHDSAFPLLDTYMQGAPHQGPFYTWHDFSRIPVDQASKIDYIFVSPLVRVLRTLISQEDRGEHPQHLSDHNAVVASLEF